MIQLLNAFLLINTKPGRGREVVEKLLEHEEFEEVRQVYGDYDIFGKVSISSMDELNKFLLETIRNMPDVELSNTLVQMG
ncbi:MAG: Lrp/AsnC ligand binding domain-containing protein [archaeon]